MNEADFNDLVTSVKQAGQIMRGEIAPSRHFLRNHGAKNNVEPSLIPDFSDGEATTEAKMSSIAICKQCKATVKIPDISESERETLTSILRSNGPIEAIRFVRSIAALSIKEAKALEVHMTREPRICHRCCKSLQKRGISECPNCRSLNIDW